MEANINNILKEINNNAGVLVGILCKRVEVLEKEKVLTPSLYKALVKELIYENARYLKRLITANSNLGQIVFKKQIPKE